MARQSEIDDEAAAVTICNKRFEAREIGFARAALEIKGGDGIIESVPRAPDAEPVKTEPLEVIEIFAEEFIRSAERAIVAEAEEEGGFAVDRETGAVNAKSGAGG